MFFIFFAIAIVVLSVYFVFHQINQPKLEAKAKLRQEERYSEIKNDSDTEHSLENACNLANALRQIKKAGLCKVSPLTIRINTVDTFFAKLDMTFTIFSVYTAPYSDLEASVLIAADQCDPNKPMYTNKPMFITPSHLKELQAGLSPNDFSASLKELSKRIQKFCYDAIYQDLFGEPTSYFGGEISRYFLDITSYPYGDVTILHSGASVLKVKDYALAFQYLTSTLQEKFPEASIRSYPDIIEISF